MQPVHYLRMRSDEFKQFEASYLSSSDSGRSIRVRIVRAVNKVLNHSSHASESGNVEMGLLPIIAYLGITATFLWVVPLVAQEDVATIIRRSSEANNRDFAAVPHFCFHIEEDDLYLPLSQS